MSNQNFQKDLVARDNSFIMAIKQKQQWSVKETNFLLELWFPSEVQTKLVDASI